MSEYPLCLGTNIVESLGGEVKIEWHSTRGLNQASKDPLTLPKFLDGRSLLRNVFNGADHTQSLPGCFALKDTFSAAKPHPATSCVSQSKLALQNFG
jgi:hypothetical protein